MRDDLCTWWECTDNQCIPTPIGFCDMGGQFGECRVDGATDANDFIHALNCFANQDVDGNAQSYPCEQHDDFPPNTYNVDGSGPFASCFPDGVCDGNDANSALDTFGGFDLCTCPADGGPGPEFDKPLEIVDHTGITLVTSRRRIRSGDTVAVHAYLDRPLEDLQGYQLHVDASGGRRGALELIDISLEWRKRPVFDGLETWDAYNVHTLQMVVGLYDEGVATSKDGYLATFTFRATDDATGAFVVDLLADDSDPAQRSFLFPTLPRQKIAIDQTHAAVIAVSPSRPRNGKVSMEDRRP